MDQSVIDYFIGHDVLVSPTVEDKPISQDDAENIIEMFNDELDVLNQEVLDLYNQRRSESGIKVNKSYEEKGRSRSFQDFVKTFNARYENLRSLLENRNQLNTLSSINRVKNKERGSEVGVIAMIRDKQTTKNDNIILTLEDKTGTCKALIKPEQEPELGQQGQNLVLDETVGINGAWLSGILYINDIIFPEVPHDKPLKKGPEESYAAFLGDPHFGSKFFLEDEFKKFIKWTKGELGSKKHQHIASKLDYIICPGDIVEGVGIYPGQEDDLAIKDIKEQYKEAARWLDKIPKDIEMVFIPGNHDVGRLAEPQHTISKEYVPDLWAMDNVQLASNPSTVTIGQTKDFDGFDILLYHGGSLVYYADKVPRIREKGGQQRSDLIMEFLLQRRHLAPTHGSTPYVPGDEDHLLIDDLPDFFITGHIHRARAKNYRHITMINASTWGETTEDQIKRGLEPQPGRVPIVNLQNRQMTIINFLTEDTKREEQKRVERATEV
jgi:DNA polymerase II small subunit